jgi:hypothetical protein
MSLRKNPDVGGITIFLRITLRLRMVERNVVNRKMQLRRECDPPTLLFTIRRALTVKHPSPRNYAGGSLTHGNFSQSPMLHQALNLSSGRIHPPHLLGPMNHASCTFLAAKADGLARSTQSSACVGKYSRRRWMIECIGKARWCIPCTTANCQLLISRRCQQSCDRGGAIGGFWLMVTGWSGLGGGSGGVACTSGRFKVIRACCVVTDDLNRGKELERQTRLKWFFEVWSLFFIATVVLHS